MDLRVNAPELVNGSLHRVLPWCRAVLLGLVLTGCRQQATPLANPFFGSSRVPAPATRTPAPGTAQPYYGGDSAPPPITPGGATRQPPAGQRLGQAQSGTDIVHADALAQAALPEEEIDTTGSRRVAANSDTSPIAIPTDDQRVRFAQHMTPDAAAAQTQSGTRRRPSPDIGDLPPVRPEQAPDAQSREALLHRTGSSPEDAFRPRRDIAFKDASGVQQATFLTTEAESAKSAALSARREGDRENRRSTLGRSRYGYASDYAWLQGRLEHSQANNRWKLRYIPVDGETDAYGGSVILENPEELGDLAAGDFVRVRGILLEGEQDTVSFAPAYRISQLQPLAD
jgi:hypothetical protein